MHSPEHADAIVIGSGQGGVPFALALARDGKRVVLFERGALGGTCVNTGCTPSKAFLASAHAAGRARAASRIGVHANITIDGPAVLQRVRDMIADFSDGVAKKIVDAGVRCVRGEAHFTGPRTVSGGGVTVEAPLVLINTGCTAVVPPIPGLEGTPFLTNSNVFNLRAIPKRTLVLGGGYIGLELGQGLARLGSRVCIVHRGARVLENEEADVSEVLQTQLRHDGVDLSLNSEAVSVAHDGRTFTLELKNGERFEAEALLVAVGRAPLTELLHPEAAGVAVDDKGYIKIDDTFRTTAEGIYAIGDVARQPAFTHVSWEDYRRLRAILAGKKRTRDDRVLAYAVYTEPQVGRVGMSLAQAQAKGIDAVARTMRAEDVARAIEWDQTAGFYRLVVERSSGTILGATFVAYEAAELVHVIVAHIMAGSTWHRLDESVHIHPTYAEGLPSLARMFAEKS